MKKLPAFLLFALCVWARGASAENSQIRELPPLAAGDRILILSPHPDDEMLCCSAVLQTAHAKNLPVKIVFFTSGESYTTQAKPGRKLAAISPAQALVIAGTRHDEAVAASKVIGIEPRNLEFLGYPDGGTFKIWLDHWGESLPFRSGVSRVDAVPYQYAYRPGAAYKGEEVLRDLETIVRDFKPTKVFVSHPADGHRDHLALALFTRVALWNADENRAALYVFLTHFKQWSKELGFFPHRYLMPPDSLRATYEWLSFPVSPAQEDKKSSALQAHHTQYVSDNLELLSFIRPNEIFSDFPEGVSPGIEIKDGNLVVMAPAPSKDTKAIRSFFVFAYRFDKPFGAMPHVIIKAGTQRERFFGLNRKARQKIKVDRGVEGKISITIPLSVLNNPQRILTSIDDGPWRAVSIQ